MRPLDVHEDKVAVLVDLESFDEYLGGCVLGVSVRERAEVVHANEAQRSGADPREI